MIQKSIPASQKAIADAVMLDLNTWLYRIRETSQFLGEVAFYHTEMRRSRHKERSEKDETLTNFKLNSAIELVFEEDDEFDVLANDEVEVEFKPLFECLHIHQALNQSDKLRNDYAATRRQQKDLLMPTSIHLDGEEEPSLNSLLEGISGFAIIEKASLQRVPQLRSSVEVGELWDSMCTSAIALTSRSLSNVTNAEVLLKIKSVFALFIQTMEGWGYSVTMLDNFLLTLFDKYAELLKRRFSEDFQEIVSTDDYMPMAINTPEEYEKVVNVSWFTHDNAPQDLTFPCVLPFSQMYPLCCIDIRNFLNQFYFFADDHFHHANVIDDTLRKVSVIVVPQIIWTACSPHSTVFGRAFDTKSVSVARRAAQLPVFGPDSTNIDQSRAFRDGLPGTRTAPDQGSLIHVGRRAGDPLGHGGVPEQQEDRREANLRARQLQD